MTSQVSKPHFAYIDCVRGYAVLLVILCHLTYEFPQLPYPVHRLTTTGWFGVQLFFLASCITLLMSWRFEIEKRGSADARAFFIRRFFRIAPAYYFAAVFYFFLAPPRGGFDGWQAFTAAAFINTWHPLWTPTVHGHWTVVPGGWSIGVEFSFYFLFPFFAAYVTGLRRALQLLFACLAFGIAANLAAAAAMSGTYEPQEIANFLFFWFPNEAAVFAFGGVLFFLLRRLHAPGGKALAFVAANATAIALASAALFAALAYVPLGSYLGGRPYVPAYLAVCLPFAGLIVALSTGRTFFVNSVIASMGQVSFSAYLFHFAVLRLFGRFPEIFHTHAVGFEAILAFALAYPLTVLITYAVSYLSYRLIEHPMINAGKYFGRMLPANAPVMAGEKQSAS